MKKNTPSTQSANNTSHKEPPALNLDALVFSAQSPMLTITADPTPLEVFVFYTQSSDSWEEYPEGDDSPYSRSWGEEHSCEYDSYYTTDAKQADWYARASGCSKTQCTLFFDPSIAHLWSSPIPQVDRLPPLHLLWLTYGTGDSFGHSSGNSVALAISPHAQELLRLKDQIPFENNCSAMQESYGLRWFNGRHLFQENAPWSGYFERIENIYLQTLQPLPLQQDIPYTTKTTNRRFTR